MSDEEGVRFWFSMKTSQIGEAQNVGRHDAGERYAETVRCWSARLHERADFVRLAYIFILSTNLSPTRTQTCLRSILLTLFLCTL